MSSIHTSSRRFGTSAVFLTTISTILGAILFLRIGYAVGHQGFLGALAIILVGHMVTIPTALAIAEIATNQRVEGGGVYYMISRSFGLLIGGAIGITLYLSQAISVAFYVIAFSEAFRPALAWVHDSWGIEITDLRLVSFPTLFLFSGLIYFWGARWGLSMLYVVCIVLALSLALFFAGTGPSPASLGDRLTSDLVSHDSFFLVFAICFPAFTGLAAGVGLSGELRDSKRSIPKGTLVAVLTGMLIYLLVALKLAVSATSEELASDPLVMSSIATWSPIIPIGLACATLSSALGSLLVAPRTLQALAADSALPSAKSNGWFARTEEKSGEPTRALAATVALAAIFVLAGDVNFVARIISMFFMVTYGAICIISALEHFAADPSYRPSFRSRWYLSLIGAGACLWLMFEMDPIYAAVSLSVLFVLYLWMRSYTEARRGLSHLFQGAMFQISRKLQVSLQKNLAESAADNWRPAVVCLSSASFERVGAFEVLSWISHRYGFATYIHFIEGYLSKATNDQARETLNTLIHQVDAAEGNLYVDTLVSPSYTSAIGQIVQLPGISGKENNLVLFEYSKHAPTGVRAAIDHYPLVIAAGFDVVILRTSERNFGYKKQLHLWLTSGDLENSSLMILLAYIIIGHPSWRGGTIKIFATATESEVEERQEELQQVVKSGRLPIAAKNIEIIPHETDRPRREIINERSRLADLTVIGFRGELLKHQGEKAFDGYDQIGDILFVNTIKEIEIERQLEPLAVSSAEEDVEDGENALSPATEPVP